MTTYTINGQDIDAPDDMPADQVLTNFYAKNGGGGGSTPSTTATHQYEEVGNGINPHELGKNKDWVYASRTEYERRNGAGSAKDMSDDDVSDYALGKMGQFNYNTVAMGLDAYSIKSANPDQQASFLHLMDTYDHLNLSWGGAGRAALGMATDPLSWTGLLSLGSGTAAEVATAAALKKGVQGYLRTIVSHGIMGAAQAGIQDRIKQQAEINANGKTNVDYGELGEQSGMGFAIGGLLGAGSKALGNHFAATPKEVPEPRPEMPTGVTEADARIIPPDQAIPKFKDGTPVEDVVKGANYNREEGTTLASFDNTVDKNANVEEYNKGVHTNQSENDNVSPTARTDNPVLDAIREKGKDGEYLNRVRDEDYSTNLSKVAKEVQPIVTKLLEHPLDDLGRITREVANAAVSGTEPEIRAQAFMDAATQAKDKSTELLAKANAELDPAKQQNYLAQNAEALKRLSILRDADVNAGTSSGRTLGSRSGNTEFIASMRGTSAEALMVKDGVNPDLATNQQWADYGQKFHELMDAARANAESNQKVVAYDPQIQALHDAGDLTGALKMSAEKNALADSITDATAAQGGWSARIGRSFQTGMRLASEVVISNVLSISTVHNILLPALIQTLYRPMLDALANGMSQDAIRQMGGSYMALAGTTMASARAARMTFSFERHFITTDGISFYNRPEPVIPRSLGAAIPILQNIPVIHGLPVGGLIRFIPRVIEAIDEFFKQINYRSHVYGQAAAEAMSDGIKQGMEGDALHAHIKLRTADAYEKSFAPSIDAPRVIDYLRRQGVSNGMSGDTLDAWIKNQLDKNGDLFKAATNQASKDYADDIMFKRKFTEGDWVSRQAKSYEDYLNSSPLARLSTQLFFRTPVRLFEAGFRMTPGLQFATANPLSSGLWRDLTGVRGVGKQTFAQGQMMLSYGLAGYALLEHAKGGLSGGGPTQTGTRRTLEDGQAWQPNSISDGDGGFTNFRSMEPVGLPMRTIGNILDRMNMVNYRQAQGEYVDHETKGLLSGITAVTLSMGEALHDSPLLQTAAQVFDSFNMAQDPEKSEGKLMKLVGQQMNKLVPHTLTKYMQTQETNMNDPQNPSQFATALIHPNDPSVVKQYTALGKIRQLTNPTGSFFGLMDTSKAQKESTSTPQERKVEQWLSDIETASGIQFQAPHSIDEYGFKGIDLRKELYPNSNMSIYDKWMQEYGKSDVTDQLEKLMDTTKGMSMGRPSDHSDSFSPSVASLIHDKRKAAFETLMMNDPTLKLQLDHGVQTHKDNVQSPDPTGQPYKTGE